MPDNFTKIATNDKTASNIYAVNENGIVDSSRSLCKVRYVFENNTDDDPDDPNAMPYTDRIVLNLFDVETGEPIDEFKPVSGLYCLRLADGLFFGSYQSLVSGSAPEFLNSNPFDYYYEVENSVGVKNIDTIKSENLDIYTLSGIRVAKNADASVLSSLKPGLYIINGKKILKK